MKRMILILVAVFMAGVFSVQAQDDKLSKREKKKQERMAEQEYKYIRTGELLDSMKFVLEADYLDNQRGNRVIVPQSLNFIKVDSTDAVLQIGRNVGVGYNGVGGTTAEGRVSRYEVSKNEKKRTYDVRMNVNTNLGNYDIFMMVASDGSARATLSGIRPGKLVWDGDIVALEESSIYQGRTTY